MIKMFQLTTYDYSVLRTAAMEKFCVCQKKRFKVPSIIYEPTTVFYHNNHILCERPLDIWDRHLDACREAKTSVVQVYVGDYFKWRRKGRQPLSTPNILGSYSHLDKFINNSNSSYISVSLQLNCNNRATIFLLHG